MASVYKNIIFDICGVLFEYPSSNLISEHQKIFLPIESGISLLKKLSVIVDENREPQFQLFACTNMSEHKLKVLKSEHPDVMKLFEGIVTSEKAGYAKPDPRIFKYLCDLYGLKISECIFLDDNPDFAQSANSIGMKSIWFDNAQRVRKELSMLNIYL